MIWGKAYSIADGAILVAPDSGIQKPENLAGRDIAVGYHSGSHYSAQQALEVFLSPQDIDLKFAGPPWERVDVALARRVSAVNVWGPQRYILEQHGFRHMVDTAFMITFMFPAGANEDHIERSIRALQRAQMDIDLEPERYKHLPQRNSAALPRQDRRAPLRSRRAHCVPLPYTQDMFDKTQIWMHERKLFDVGPEVGVGYDMAVRS